jgi:hypothetical protein
MRLPRVTLRRFEVLVVFALAACLATQAYASGVYFRKAAKPKYAVTTNHATTPVFGITRAVPGDFGQGSLLVGNMGTEPARMAMTYLPVARSRLDGALQLSIYDVTTKQCYWPRPAPPRKVRKGKKLLLTYPKANPCKGMGPWTAALRAATITPKGYSPVTKAGTLTPKIKLLWKRKERHVLLVSWRLPDTVDNSGQQQTSTFRLAIKATKK